MKKEEEIQFRLTNFELETEKNLFLTRLETKFYFVIFRLKNSVSNLFMDRNVFQIGNTLMIFF